MTILKVTFALLALTGSAAQQRPEPAKPETQREGTAAPEGPKIILESSQAPGLEVHFLTIPWGPQTFAAMEEAGDSFYNRRTWPFARLTTTVPMQMDGARIPPGNYALVFHPNNPKNDGMSLEVLKVGAGEFLQPGNAMTRTPPGESLQKGLVRFGTTGTTSPTLKVGLTSGKEAVTLNVQYGDRTLTKELKTVR